MLRKLLIGWVIIVLTVVGMAWAGEPQVSSNSLQRICDGIGRQYACVSSSLVNKYGFGGVADTLSTDSTVSRGTMMNIHRIKESNDEALAELLPAFMATRSQLDSSYIYNKWSSIIWALNNTFTDSGGLNGVLQARADVDNTYRLTARFARVARANGLYLSPKVVFPESLNFGSATIGTDSAFTYSDSNAIDSTLYGPQGSTQGRPWGKVTGASGTGACSIVVWGSNQNLVHGRRWVKDITQATSAAFSFVPSVTGDSIYNIDSVKIKAYSGTLAASVLFTSRYDRKDSL